MLWRMWNAKMRVDPEYLLHLEYHFHDWSPVIKSGVPYPVFWRYQHVRVYFHSYESEKMMGIEHSSLLSLGESSILQDDTSFTSLWYFQMNWFLLLLVSERSYCEIWRRFLDRCLVLDLLKQMHSSRWFTIAGMHLPGILALPLKQIKVIRSGHSQAFAPTLAALLVLITDCTERPASLPRVSMHMRGCFWDCAYGKSLEAG